MGTEFVVIVIAPDGPLVILASYSTVHFGSSDKTSG
jgi:hypothetical protein